MTSTMGLGLAQLRRDLEAAQADAAHWRERAGTFERQVRSLEAARQVATRAYLSGVRPESPRLVVKTSGAG